MTRVDPIKPCQPSATLPVLAACRSSKTFPATHPSTPRTSQHTVKHTVQPSPVPSTTNLYGSRATHACHHPVLPSLPPALTHLTAYTPVSHPSPLVPVITRHRSAATCHSPSPNEPGSLPPAWAASRSAHPAPPLRRVPTGCMDPHLRSAREGSSCASMTSAPGVGPNCAARSRGHTSCPCSCSCSGP